MMDPLDPLRDSLDVQCKVCGQIFNVKVEAVAPEHNLFEECPTCGAFVELTIEKDANGNIINVASDRDQGA
jgi:uncharacterized Zn finger protein